MQRSVILQHLLPFLQWYALMLLLALGIDYLLHQYHLVFVGRYLGLIGTLVVVFSFAYSLRKRKMIQSGSPKVWLEWHEYLAWLGSVMLLVHAGVHFNALLPWLAIALLLISVASGLVGKFLLKRSSDLLKERRQQLLASGLSAGEADSRLFLDAVAVDLMRKWRQVHLPITFFLGVLSLLHILTILMFGK